MVEQRGRGRLFRKYVVVLVGLVSGALLTSGLVQVYFAYGENEAVQFRLQQEKASAAAAAIERFVADVVREIRWTHQPPWITEPPTVDQRLDDYGKLLRQAPAISELAYLDADGRERLRVGQIVLRQRDVGTDRSGELPYRATRGGQPYFGPVYYRDGSEPFMTVAVPEEGAGVTVAEVSLAYLWDVILPLRIEPAGYAYVVDGAGDLLAYPDLSLVLRKTNLSALPQVQAALADPSPLAAGATPAVVPSADGRTVLSAHQAVMPPGWIVFVEQPLAQALAPLIASAQRTAVLLLIGIALSILASLLLARRMVTPIRALQASAARIGAGALDERIAVHSGDELEALADEFNRMTARLRESYSNLEGKVDERTRDLGAALAALEEKSQQLAAASEHKSEFLASMSHELRTPLNAIIGFSDVLLERMFGELNPKQEEYLRDIHASGRHLLALINDILDLARVEAGRMDLEVGPFLLAEALESGLTMVKERAASHHIALTLTVDPAVDVVEADERKVKQIVFNLLSNAVKFTPDGGRVDVRARLVEDRVEVAVQDTGVGIAPADQERVFETFERVARPDTAAEGTGLGLPLVRKLVELHGGRIELESAPGQGSTFGFTLPQRQATAASSAAAPAPSQVIAGAPLVLVVEDDPRAIELLTVYLRDAGFGVAVARDGEAALAAARRLRPAAITLDITLPRLDGWDFLTRVKADPDLADVPVVIVSMVDERGKGFVLGAADYMVKPVQREALLAVLRRVTAAGATEPPTVLAIDDDPLALSLVEAVLGPHGYRILIAASGEEGLALARQERPALVILDLMMPGLSGFDVVDALRGHPATAAIPIMLLTAATLTPEDKARLNGQIDHLAHKGEFTREAFVEVVRHLCPVTIA